MKKLLLSILFVLFLAGCSTETTIVEETKVEEPKIEETIVEESMVEVEVQMAAKPVIYLYPETICEVEVKLDYVGELSLLNVKKSYIFIHSFVTFCIYLKIFFYCPFG